nr:flagellar basal body rod C-terminal domain-containing protein [Ningiella sp. W23]
MINLTPIGGGVIAENAQIKLASTDENLIKGADGLLRANDLQPLEADETITVRTGALEGSNVNAVAEMIKTMNISRQFEMNVKMMKSADELATSGNKLISGRG